MYKIKKKIDGKGFFLYSPYNIFLKDNRFGSDLFVYVFVHFTFIFFPYTYYTLSYAASECMRVTAGVSVQQMNILIRRPLRWQKPGDCTLIAFYPYPLYPLHPFAGLFAFISSFFVVFLVALRCLWIFWTSITLSVKPFIASIIWPKSTLIYIYLQISVDREISWHLGINKFQMSTIIRLYLDCIISICQRAWLFNYPCDTVVFIDYV